MNSKPDFADLFLPCEKIINIIQYRLTMEMGILSMRFARTGLFTIEMVRFICICVSVFCTGAAFAKSGTCSNGQFLFSTKCRTCPAGCYCTGGNTETMSLDPDNKIKASVLESYCKGESDSCPQGKANGGEAYGACGRHNNAKLFRCPRDYAYSAAGATSITSCYAKCNGQPLYYEQKSCKSGEYRPKGTNDCKPCPDDGKSYCTGVSNFYRTCDGASSDQGKSTCDIDNGKVPNSTRTACVDKKCAAGEELKDGKCVSIKIHCIAGEYLPANSESCAACPSGKVCLGGDFDKRSIDQGDDGTCDGNNIINSKGSGCTPCPAGTAPNENHTVCSETAIHVDPGYYLRPNSAEPTSCANAGARKYCPGGDYKKGPSAAGIFDCPFNGTSEDHITCNVSITEEQMQYGPAGKNAPLESQCWLRTDPDDYRTCIFGTRFDVSKDK